MTDAERENKIDDLLERSHNASQGYVDSANDAGEAATEFVASAGKYNYKRRDELKRKHAGLEAIANSHRALRNTLLVELYELCRAEGIVP